MKSEVCEDAINVSNTILKRNLELEIQLSSESFTFIFKEAQPVSRNLLEIQMHVSMQYT